MNAAIDAAMKDLTIVVPSYETRGLLVSCLGSIESACSEAPELDVEVIVVDNGSRDGSPEAVRERFPGVRLIALARNRGFARAINRGLQARRGRIVLLLNSDVEIEFGLLRGAVALLDKHQEIGVLGPALRHPSGRRQRSVHPLPSLATELLPEFLLRWVRPRAYDRRSEADPGGAREVEAVRGAAFFIRSSVLEKLAGFDERYFFFLEETDFCRRVRRGGATVAHAPGLSATHRQGASSKRRAPLATRIEFHRSLYRYLELNQGGTTARIARFARLLRGAVVVLGLTVSYPFLASSRRRFSERWGLWIWHLRGCPEKPPLCDVLAAQLRKEAALDESGQLEGSSRHETHA